jgi:predicted nuclease of predicted toxin-antitoxin system
MRLLIDMNLSPAWVDWLAAAGIESVHWTQIGNPAAPDSEILDYARDHGMIVITNDLDFSAILAAVSGSNPSVVQLRALDLRPAEIGPRVVIALRQVEPELVQGAVLTIDVANARLRLLPLTL